MNHQIQIKDELKLSQNTKIVQQLVPQPTHSNPQIKEAENILFSCLVKKFNFWGLQQQRTLLITQSSIYNFKDTTMKRQIKLKDVMAITLSTCSDEFVVHVSDNSDYRFTSENRKKVIEWLVKIYRIYIKENIKAIFVEDKQLEKFTNRKKGQNKVQFDKYVLLDEEGWSQVMERKRTSSLLTSFRQDVKISICYQKDKKEKAVPELIDFKILNMIGRGTISEVFLVERNNTERKYALKVINKGSLSSQTNFDLLETLNSIKQYRPFRFLLQLEYCYLSNNNFYFLSKFYASGDLFNYLKKKGRLEEDEARFYFIELAVLLGMLHEKNIRHGDIKPENVLVDDDGHVVLTDFGIARGIKYQNKNDYIIGTPEYLPPEVL